MRHHQGPGSGPQAGTSAGRSHRVLVVNTGGTIAMVHEDDNPLSPLVPGDWDRIIQRYPLFSRLPFEAEIEILDPLLDSADMTSENWKQIAGIIEASYDDFDGFVVLHGTDTMCNTASALSFMLENLAKPVILTGAQLPLAKPRSDAPENFVTALCIAAGLDVNDGSEIPLVPEVAIYFGSKLLRGNRARKLSASAYEGFESPNYGELGRVGEHIEVDRARVREVPEGEFFTSTALNTNVLSIDVIPSLDPRHLLAAALDAADAADPGRAVDGLVLKTFGAGNAPGDPKLLGALEKIVRQGVVVVNVTQCSQGMVEVGRYEGSARLLDVGVSSGLDMTPEAALGKLMWLLGKGWPRDEVVAQMQLDQRGEQSLNVHTIEFGAGAADPLCTLQQKVPGDLDLAALDSATIRLSGVEAGAGQCELLFFLNHDRLTESSDESMPQYVGTLAASSDRRGRYLLLRANEAVRRMMRSGQIASIGVVSRSGARVSWKSLSLSLNIRP